MSALVIEPFSTVAAWTAHRPDGSPSTAIAISPGGPPRVPPLSAPSATLHADTGADGHYVERTGGPVDLTSMQDLLLWVRGTRRADGSAAAPLYLQVELGSTAVPVGAVTNTWRRMVPLLVPGTWEPVPLALADLPAAVRSGVTDVRLTCLDADTAWSLDVDAVLAVRPEVLADADAALLARLDGRLQVSGTAVPAVLLPVAGQAPQPPVFRISNYDVRPDRATSPVDGPRTDYTDRGFAIRPPATVYQLDYAIEAVAADRTAGAAMLGFVLAELAPRATLLAAGRQMSAEWVDAPATAAPPVVAPPPDHPVVHVRVTAAQPGTGTAQRAVPPFNDISVEVDHATP